jgi:hypothetical protein
LPNVNKQRKSRKRDFLPQGFQRFALKSCCSPGMDAGVNNALGRHIAALLRRNVPSSTIRKDADC